LHVPSLQVPQEPPHPSLPQVLPVQLAAHVDVWHWPEALHVPLEQVPQLPPQPSAPHSRPEHAGAQLHLPDALHVFPLAQTPQAPPHPSGPQARPAQSATHDGFASRLPASLERPPSRPSGAAPSASAAPASSAAPSLLPGVALPASSLPNDAPPALHAAISHALEARAKGR